MDFFAFPRSAFCKKSAAKHLGLFIVCAVIFGTVLLSCKTDGDGNGSQIQRPSGAVWHDENCTCGGTVMVAEHSEGGIVVTCTGTHDKDNGAAGNAHWKSKLNYDMDTPYEAPYLVSFEAKADEAYDTFLSVNNALEGVNLADCVPLSLGTTYKSYSYMFFVNSQVLEENSLGFSILKGKTYVRNLTIQNMWGADFNGETPWSIWQLYCPPREGGYNAGYVTLYEMTDSSVKAVRNTCDMEIPGLWHTISLFLKDKSAGKYCASFTDESEHINRDAQKTVDSVKVKYFDSTKGENGEDVVLCNLEGFGGENGKYYFYFDVPQEHANKPLELNFATTRHGAAYDERFILKDVKVEKVTAEQEILDATRLDSLR